jgi:hypothetical protein
MVIPFSIKIAAVRTNCTCIPVRQHFSLTLTFASIISVCWRKLLCTCRPICALNVIVVCACIYCLTPAFKVTRNARCISQTTSTWCRCYQCYRRVINQTYTTSAFSCCRVYVQKKSNIHWRLSMCLCICWHLRWLKTATIARWMELIHQPLGLVVGSI